MKKISAIPLPVIYPEFKLAQIYRAIRHSIVLSSKTENTLKCPLKRDWINELQSIHRMENHAAVKRTAQISEMY